MAVVIQEPVNTALRGEAVTDGSQPDKLKTFNRFHIDPPGFEFNVCAMSGNGRPKDSAALRRPAP
jgi:hypothetical protein